MKIIAPVLLLTHSKYCSRSSTSSTQYQYCVYQILAPVPPAWGRRAALLSSTAVVQYSLYEVILQYGVHYPLLQLHAKKKLDHHFCNGYREMVITTVIDSKGRGPTKYEKCVFSENGQNGLFVKAYQYLRACAIVTLKTRNNTLYQCNKASVNYIQHRCRERLLGILAFNIQKYFKVLFTVACVMFVQQESFCLRYLFFRTHIALLSLKNVIFLKNRFINFLT